MKGVARAVRPVRPSTRRDSMTILPNARGSGACLCTRSLSPQRVVGLCTKNFDTECPVGRSGPSGISIRQATPSSPTLVKLGVEGMENACQGVDCRQGAVRHPVRGPLCYCLIKAALHGTYGPP